jgi:large subunit ribosomal protein L1
MSLLSRVEVKMDDQTLKTAIDKLKSDSKKRNFSQSYDLILNLKDINIKKQDGQIDIYVNLPHSTGKEIRVCGLVGPEMYDDAKSAFHKVIGQDDFASVAKNKKEIKNIAEECDFFVAQADIMGKVAGAFGRVLGPKGKMPNPKAGCVVPPKTNLIALQENLGKKVHVTTKKEAIIKIGVGKDNMDDKHIIENIMHAYNTIIHNLPLEKNNIKSVLLKLTMSKPVKLE